MGPEFAPMIGLFILFGALVVVLIIVSSSYEKKKLEERRLQMQQLAERLGFQYLPESLGGVPESGFLGTFFGWGEVGPEDRFLALFQGFSPFGLGHSQCVRSLVAGRKTDADWLIFDYEYKITTSTGKTTSTRTYRPSIVAARLPIALPMIRIGQESLFSRLGNLVGIQDIQFESEEFNRRYRVVGQDVKAIYSLIHPKTIEFLMASRFPEWQVGGQLVVLQFSEWVSPESMLYAMSEIDAFADLIPGFVRQDRSLPLAPKGPMQGIIE